jgi:hypothetical protein
MAIRLRTVDGVRVALCAVESDPKPGDVYLDDSDGNTEGQGCNGRSREVVRRS